MNWSKMSEKPKQTSFQQNRPAAELGLTPPVDQIYSNRSTALFEAAAVQLLVQNGLVKGFHNS